MATNRASVAILDQGYQALMSKRLIVAEPFNIFGLPRGGTLFKSAEGLRLRNAAVAKQAKADTSAAKASQVAPVAAEAVRSRASSCPSVPPARSPSPVAQAEGIVEAGETPPSVVVLMRGQICRRAEGGRNVGPDTALDMSDLRATMSSVRRHVLDVQAPEAAITVLATYDENFTDTEYVAFRAALLAETEGYSVEFLPITLGATQSASVLRALSVTIAPPRTADWFIVLRYDALLKRPLTLADWCSQRRVTCPFWQLKAVQGKRGRARSEICDVIWSFHRSLGLQVLACVTHLSQRVEALWANSVHRMAAADRDRAKDDASRRAPLVFYAVDDTEIDSNSRKKYNSWYTLQGRQEATPGNPALHVTPPTPTLGAAPSFAALSEGLRLRNAAVAKLAKADTSAAKASQVAPVAAKAVRVAAKAAQVAPAAATARAKASRVAATAPESRSRGIHDPSSLTIQEYRIYCRLRRRSIAFQKSAAAAAAEDNIEVERAQTHQDAGKAAQARQALRPAKAAKAAQAAPAKAAKAAVPKAGAAKAVSAQALRPPPAKATAAQEEAAQRKLLNELEAEAAGVAKRKAAAAPATVGKAAAKLARPTGVKVAQDTGGKAAVAAPAAAQPKATVAVTVAAPATVATVATGRLQRKKRMKAKAESNFKAKGSVAKAIAKEAARAAATSFYHTWVRMPSNVAVPPPPPPHALPPRPPAPRPPPPPRARPPAPPLAPRRLAPPATPTPPKRHRP